MQIEIIYLATLKKMTFGPIKFVCKKRDSHSKRERMKKIDLHLKRVFAE